MIFTLRRLSLGPNATYGQIADDRDRQVCMTLELPWKDNKPDVSCIPAGTYEVVRYASPSHGYDVFLVKGVPGRSYIEIHKGNTVADTHGCIVVGRRFGMVGDQHGVTDSALAFDALMKRLEGVDCFTLSITNPS